MTGATVCSGIQAPEVAAPFITWKWCAEIEPFPCAVIAHHSPGQPNLGDITADDFIERAAALGPLDILVAGTPCQAFSVAGNRESLADSRGNLTLRFVEIVNALNPRWILWENVPGVLTTKDNAFGCLMAGLVGASTPIAPAGRWTRSGVVTGPERQAAWTIQDAQYHGLAQRRKRVFVVAGARNWASPAEILLKWEGVPRHIAPRRDTGESFTHSLAPSLTSSGRGVDRAGDSRGQDAVVAVASTGETSHCLNAGGMGRIDYESETFIAFNLRGREDGAQVELADVASLRSASGGSSRSYVQQAEVRRLLPKECCILQGFSSDYFDNVIFRGKKPADGNIYKALGNAMPVNVIRWIIDRIRAVDEEWSAALAAEAAEIEAALDFMEID